MKNSRVVETVELRLLKPPAVRRHHTPKQQAAIDHSVLANGQVGLIPVTPDYEIIDGEAICAALVRNGIKTVRVEVFHDQTSAEVQALRAMLHRSSLGGHWDTRALGASLFQIKAAGIDLQTAGFTDDLLLKLIGRNQKIDLQASSYPPIRSGDQWECGGHAIGFGQANDEQLIAQLLRGRTPDICTFEFSRDGIVNGFVSAAVQQTQSTSPSETITSQFQAITKVIGPETLIFVGVRGDQLEGTLASTTSLGMPLLEICIRTNHMSQNAIFKNAHLPVLIFGTTEKAKLRQFTRTRITNVWSKVQKAINGSPEMGLTANILKHLTKPGATILDTNLATGSTLWAASECGRTCVGIEQDLTNFQNILQRWDALASGLGAHRAKPQNKQATIR